MKKIYVVLAVAVLITLVAAGAAMAGIYNSKHNLSNTAPGTLTRNHAADNTNEICVFCHTPHGATAGWQPIWNRAVDNGTVFTTYGTTLAGTVAGTVSSRTRLCLSCHDGAYALISLNNPPNSAGGSVTMTNNTISGNALVDYDLSNDHPIAVVYTDMTKASLRTLTVTTDQIVKITAVNVPNGITGTSVVECASCHEPHAENALFAPISGGNASSQLCITCHMK